MKLISYYTGLKPCSHLTSAFTFEINKRMVSMATNDIVHTPCLRLHLHQTSKMGSVAYLKSAMTAKIKEKMLM